MLQFASFSLKIRAKEVLKMVDTGGYGKRIKARRTELGMTQEELAKKIGYTSRSSINKIELDGRGLPQTKIVAIAKALNTTPAYIMGWEDEIDIDRLADLTNKLRYDVETQEMLEKYFELSEDKKAHIRNTIEMISNNNK
jgi:transcriptional regulator with XRE-family HTH domain